LMTDDGYIESGFGFGRVLDIKNDARGREKQNGDDKDGNDRPGQLNLGAAKDLGWFAAVIIVSATETNDDVNEKAANDGKNQAGDCKCEVRKCGN
jgi:hypothetical protein